MGGGGLLGFITVLEECLEIIGEGAIVFEGWIGSLLHKLWPYLLMILGIVIVTLVG